MTNTIKQHNIYWYVCLLCSGDRPVLIWFFTYFISLLATITRHGPFNTLSANNKIW